MLILKPLLYVLDIFVLLFWWFLFVIVCLYSVQTLQLCYVFVQTYKNIKKSCLT